ncbi:DUF4326 domain-containing protein [Micromonospora sp. NPDC000668]|uniref:DUF4326 domain-containing protein n=1 Tax=Micromonospora sp. NPDC000668 TaxID=3364219 RepID=UPI0036C68251
MRVDLSGDLAGGGVVVRPGPDGTRNEILDKYRAYLLGRPDLLALRPGLRGRRLGCWCVPERCHAEVIAELADSLPTSSLR